MGRALPTPLLLPATTATLRGEVKEFAKAWHASDPVFDGAGAPLALGLLIALWVLLPAGERRYAFLPAVMLAGHAVLVAIAGSLRGQFADDFLRLPAVFLLLACIGRSGFLLFANALWVRRLARPLPKILHDLIQAAIYAAVGLLVLRAAGVEPGSLLTTSALLTAVIGLSLQDTLGNLFAGLAIQAQRPFEPGDWIQFDQESTHIGRVIEINWRATRLRTLERLEVIVPNGMVAKAPIVNYSRPDATIRREVSVVAPYHLSPDRVRQWLLSAVRHTPRVLDSPAPVVVTNDYNDRGVEYLVRYFIDEFEWRERIESDVRDRLWYALAREGVMIPVPGARIELRRAASGAEVEPGTESVDFRARLLARLEFFRGLPTEELNRLATMTRRQTFAPEEWIVREGETTSEMFIIEEGRVRVEADTRDGCRVLTELGRGDFFGEMSLLTGEQRTANVVAATETRVVVLDRETVSPLLAANPQLAELISRVLAERQHRLLELRGSLKPSAVEQERKEEELLNRIKRFFHL